MSATPLVSMLGVVKRFGGVVANEHVDFEVATGEVHALLGENGAGKSTLMQILYGLYRPDEGRILVEGREVAIGDPAQAIGCGIGMVHQEFMLVQPMSVVENVVLGRGGSRTRRLDLQAAARRLETIARQHGLSVDPWSRVADLPIGVQQRVEILKLLYRDAKLLILDEPTAVLTPAETEGLFATLRSLATEGRAVVIVTHKLREIMAVADRVSVMRAGRLIATVAVPETSELDLARRMVGRDVVLRVDKAPAHLGPVALDVTGLVQRDAAGRRRLGGIDLAVRCGEILGIAGVDGNGQSELADALFGLAPVEAGRVSLNGVDITGASPFARRAAGIGFVPADRRGTGALATLPITDNAVLGDHLRHRRCRGLMLDRRAIAARATRIVAHFGVRAAGLSLAAGRLSGGNLQKLILGREMLRKPKLLVVEQPTRGLDIGSVEAVWAALLEARRQGVAVLLISAELEEILNLSDRIAVLYGGQIAGTLPTCEATLDRLSLLMAGSRAAAPEPADAAA